MSRLPVVPIPEQLIEDLKSGCHGKYVRILCTDAEGLHAVVLPRYGIGFVWVPTIVFYPDPYESPETTFEVGLNSVIEAGVSHSVSGDLSGVTVRWLRNSKGEFVRSSVSGETDSVWGLPYDYGSYGDQDDESCGPVNPEVDRAIVAAIEDVFPEE